MNSLPPIDYRPNFIDESLENLLLAEIDRNPWFPVAGPGSRLVQHFGVPYNYKRGGSGGSNIVAPPFPPTINFVAQSLNNLGIMPTPRQCIVNLYNRDQGIGAHYDSREFGDIVASISLLNDTNMLFSGRSGTIYAGQKFELLLQKRSLLVMSGPYRYDFTHAIPKRSYVEYQGQKITKPPNYQRVSITFRTLK